ncbi:hypothetical protein M9H77_08553 [Catharanthus roseus]|uniref:Uncharacterized protein n=1 Tax=Catharanthus roseus TaxID=4058 RepID=A0ACC0BY35_CATRO|nr:hypothetical protein M9H77_08553 [Catharanthus roseus]
MWLPYYDRSLVPSDLWWVEVPLICYEIVEYNYSGRVMRQLFPDAVDTCLGLHEIQLRGNDNTSWVTQHAIDIDTWNQWRVRVRDGPAVAVEALLYPNDEYIMYHHGFTSLAGVHRRMMTIIQWCMVSIGGTLGCTPSQHDIQATFPVQPSRRRPQEYVPDRGARGVKMGARRHPGRGAGAPQRQEHVDPGPAVVEKGEGSASSQ